MDLAWCKRLCCKYVHDTLGGTLGGTLGYSQALEWVASQGETARPWASAKALVDASVRMESLTEHVRLAVFGSGCGSPAMAAAHKVF